MFVVYAVVNIRKTKNSKARNTKSQMIMQVLNKPKVSKTYEEGNTKANGEMRLFWVPFHLVLPSCSTFLASDLVKQSYCMSTCYSPLFLFLFEYFFKTEKPKSFSN